MYTPIHVLSQKSTQQRRNVFIWCGYTYKVTIGFHVDDESPISISTAYRWITTAVHNCYPRWEAAKSYSLFPVVVRPGGVLTYSVSRNGPALSRESHEMITPGDYGIFAIDGSKPKMRYRFQHTHSFSGWESAMEGHSVALAAKSSLTSLIQQALDRDGRCIFSGVIPSVGSDVLVATWVFPPFLGYMLTKDILQNEYHLSPNTCVLSEFMVITNVVLGRRDLIALFWDNKLGIDVDCLAVSACRGDVREDYYEQDIENFMEDLGIYDNEIDSSDPRWESPLGKEVYSYLLRQKLAGYIDEETESEF